MKFLHLSDLHLGKNVNGFSMLEDQAYILNKILEIADKQQPDGVLIAGDVYDKSIPPAEAVEMFDQFLVDLAGRNLQVFLISGNHDSPERVAFGGRLMDARGIHIAPVYQGQICPITMEDAYGKLDIYLLPFIRPAQVRKHLQAEEPEIRTYTDAIREVIAQMPINPKRRNILVTHQFVTGALRCDSEELSVGGADNVDAEVFAGFDYVALGHIHRPQQVGSERIRYCGSPLKYSFSEADHEKSVTVVELRDASEGVQLLTVPLVPRRDLKELRGTYEELTARSFYEGTSYREEYVHITLTDEEDILNAASRLRVIYPYLMKLDYDNVRTRHQGSGPVLEDMEQQSPAELFAAFYEQQNGGPMTKKQEELLQDMIARVWEEQV